MAFEDVNFTIKQGELFTKGWLWEDDQTPPVPINLTGCTARMEIRPNIDSDVVVAAFDTTPGAGEGLIELGGAAGTVDLSADGATTMEWARSGVYDLFVYFGDEPRKLLAGYVTIEKAVTR